LYRATKVNGKWGNIQPLPFNDKKSNTANPSVSKDGKTLYFSSSRKGSLGETDIWKVEVKGNNTYGEPVNLGPKVNTEGKESFPYITDDNKLFFSSDRPKGFGGYDIYMFDFNKDAEAINLGDPVNTPKDDFSFTFNTTKNVGFFASNRGGSDDLYLATPICGVEALITVKDSKTGKTLANAKVSIMDDRGNVIESKTADGNGVVSYNVDCDKAYAVKAAADGYLNNTFPVNKAKGGVVNVAANLDPIESIIVGDKVVLSNIYFEFDKSNVTNEAAFELNKLVEVMKSNPNMVIMAKAHTDNSGSDEYNLKLSDQRAKAVVQYIISQGIEKERISGQGYGETQPLVNCGENCTEEQQAQNRRSEFIIVKR
jgi:outer membrane protein OmpA-like peptidoglycan-associated protein